MKYVIYALVAALAHHPPPAPWPVQRLLGRLLSLRQEIADTGAPQ